MHKSTPTAYPLATGGGWGETQPSKSPAGEASKMCDERKHSGPSLR